MTLRITFILAVFLGGTPLIASDIARASIIQDPFYYNNIRRCTITPVLKGNSLLAMVQAGTEEGHESRKSLTTPLWQHVKWDPNDERLFAQEVGDLSIMFARPNASVSSLTLHNYTHPLKHPYQPLGSGFSFKTESNKILVYRVENYARPNKTTYEKMCELLYYIGVEEIKVPSNPLMLCQREEFGIPKASKTQPHIHTTYNMEAVTHKISITSPTTGLQETLKDQKIRYEARRSHAWTPSDMSYCFLKETNPDSYEGLPLKRFD